MVIIKKEGEAVIDSPLAAIFRRVNIVEYKSPGDHLSVGDYHKAGAYARLYSVQNRVETGEMSISFVVEAHPRKLLEYLVKEYGYEVQEEWPGIYYGKGDIFPVQIVESKQLGDWGGVKWLKELRGGLKGEELREIIEMSGSMPKGAPLSAYLYTILRANSRGLKELMAMSDAAFEAVLKEYGFTAKWETEGLEKGREEAVIRLQKYGMEPKQISEALELPLGTVFRYLKAE
ncbi:MAG: hypothetical protein LBP81_07090 [Treponema sp.]|nr:hypothetical protein [Treponema sp.]